MANEHDWKDTLAHGIAFLLLALGIGSCTMLEKRNADSPPLIHIERSK